MGTVRNFIDYTARAILSGLIPDATLPAKLEGASGYGTPGARAAAIDHQHGSAIVGVSDGSGAAAGEVGAFHEQFIATASPVALAGSSLITDIATITIPAGDYDLSGDAAFVTDATASVSRILACLSETSQTLTSGRLSQFTYIGGVVLDTPTNGSPSFVVPSLRISFAGAPRTFFLVAMAVYTLGNVSARGCIRARVRR